MTTPGGAAPSPPETPASATVDRAGESVLRAIRDQERAAARAVDEARRAAEARADAAEAEARRFVAGAAARGARTGAAAAAELLEHANRRADAHRAAGVEAVAALRAHAEAQWDTLVETMVRAVLPSRDPGD